MNPGLLPKMETEFCSAEFQPEKPGIFYQFKLRKNDSEAMFAVVKKGSLALACIKAGSIITMTYHFQDKTIPAQKKQTRIKYIIDGNPMGFKDHCMIALDIESVEENGDGA